MATRRRRIYSAEIENLIIGGRRIDGWFLLESGKKTFVVQKNWILDYRGNYRVYEVDRDSLGVQEELKGKSNLFLMYLFILCAYPLGITLSKLIPNIVWAGGVNWPIQWGQAIVQVLSVVAVVAIVFHVVRVLRRKSLKKKLHKRGGKMVFVGKIHLFTPMREQKEGAIEIW